MSVPHLFSAGGIVVHDTALASAVGFAGLVNQQVELGNEVRTLRQFGSVYESAVAITSRSPSIQWGTTQVKTALDLLGGVGRCIRSDETHPGLDAYLLKHDECNARDATDLERYRVEQGYLFGQTLTASHRGVASMTGTCVASSKGGNEPLQVDPSIAAPTGLADTEQWGMYNHTIGGVELPGAKDLSIDFGVQVTPESADGAIFPEWISVGSVVSRVTLSGINPRWLAASAIPLGGKKLLHSDTTLRLVRYVSDGSGAYVDPTSSQHITITVAGLGTITTAANASDDGVASTSLMLYAIHDGTNAPLVIDTAAALSS